MSTSTVDDPGYTIQPMNQPIYPGLQPAWSASASKTDTTLALLHATRSTLLTLLSRLSLLYTTLHNLAHHLTKYTEISPAAVALVRLWSTSPALRGDLLPELERKVPAWPKTRRWTQEHVDDLQILQLGVLDEAEGLRGGMERMVWDMRMVLNDCGRNYGMQ